MRNKVSFFDCVLDGFSSCKIDVNSISRIGVAVSGGADSVSLLLSLVEIFGKEKIRVLTVNHNIRPKEETKGDADFVVELCRKLGVFCVEKEIERGKIESNSNNFGGIEATARFLRYQEFYNFIEENNLDFLCLAHNKNDQLETALMRFLQGSGCDGGGGIAIRREKIIRPLLNISRDEIENFLKEKNQTWRTDSTNFDTNYLRNKIRNKLIPNLNELFEGWADSVLNGVEKNANDNFTLNSIAEKESENLLKHNENEAFVEKEKFFEFSDSIKRRFFYKMLSKIEFKSRFPYKLIREICNWDFSKNQTIQFSNVKISVNQKYLKIEKNETKKEILESGFYKIKKIENKDFIFRSFQNGDLIQMKNGKKKEISKIFSEWKVSKSDKNRVTIVQDTDSFEIVAILGEKLGYKNWIVSECGFCFSSADI